MTEHIDARPLPAADHERPPPTAPRLPDRVPLGLIVIWAGVATFGVLIVLLAAYGLYAVRSILVLVLIGLFIAISLEPAVQWLIARGLRRPLAISIVVLVSLALFVAFAWSVVPPIINQGGTLIRDLPSYLQQLSNESRAVREVTDRYHLTERLTAAAENLPGVLTGGAVGFVQRLFGVLGSSLTVVVLSIYFMADMPRLRRGVTRGFPPRLRPKVTKVVDVVVDKVGSYMIGNLIISVFAGVSTFACLELVGVPFALPLAVAVAVTDLIPMIGATLGAAICVTVTVFASGIWPEAVIVLAFFIAYQQVENYLIAPRVLRSSVDLSAVAVLLVALVGGTVLGIAGAVMAIPLAAAVKVIFTPAVAAMDRASSEADPPPADQAPGQRSCP
jgi:predicted PurR-regulated permease PerM